MTALVAQMPLHIAGNASCATLGRFCETYAAPQMPKSWQCRRAIVGHRRQVPRRAAALQPCRASSDVHFQVETPGSPGRAPSIAQNRLHATGAAT